MTTELYAYTWQPRFVAFVIAHANNPDPVDFGDWLVDQWRQWRTETGNANTSATGEDRAVFDAWLSERFPVPSIGTVS